MTHYRALVLFAAVGAVTLIFAAMPVAQAQVPATHGAELRPASDTHANAPAAMPENNTGGRAGATSSSIGQSNAHHDQGTRGSTSKPGSTSGSGHDAGASTNSY